MHLQFAFLLFTKYIIKLMNKDPAYGNRIIKKLDYQRARDIHLQTIRKAKPVVRPLEGGQIDLNNKKKQFQREARYTQIERQNRLLLEKINTIMNKTKRDFNEYKHNNSLNQNVRRKKMQQIQVENARFLKRLQTGKSDYSYQKHKSQWSKQKETMKLMTRTPFLLTGNLRRKRANSVMNQTLSPLSHRTLQISRVKVINGLNFMITICMNSKYLRIVGECKDTKQIKIVEIPKEEAIEFIEQELQGRIELLFNQLRYDRQVHVLYLIGKSTQIDAYNQQQNDYSNLRKEQKQTKAQILWNKSEVEADNTKQQNQRQKNTNQVNKINKQQIM